MGSGEREMIAEAGYLAESHRKTLIPTRLQAIGGDFYVTKGLTP